MACCCVSAVPTASAQAPSLINQKTAGPARTKIASLLESKGTGIQSHFRFLASCSGRAAQAYLPGFRHSSFFLFLSRPIHCRLFLSPSLSRQIASRASASTELASAAELLVLLSCRYYDDFSGTRFSDRSDSNRPLFNFFFFFPFGPSVTFGSRDCRFRHYTHFHTTTPQSTNANLSPERVFEKSFAVSVPSTTTT